LSPSASLPDYLPAIPGCLLPKEQALLVSRPPGAILRHEHTMYIPWWADPADWGGYVPETHLHLASYAQVPHSHSLPSWGVALPPYAVTPHKGPPCNHKRSSGNTVWNNVRWNRRKDIGQKYIKSDLCMLLYMHSQRNETIICAQP
jgi:hypothetical protein